MNPVPSIPRWMIAISGAVVFPAVILHSTCIAVMGPGTWGSGLEEALPPFRKPTDTVEQYRQEFAADDTERKAAVGSEELPSEVSITGDILWRDHSENRAILLTEEKYAGAGRQHLYMVVDGQLTEVPIPPSHLVVRPRWAGDRIIYERWNPWAIPPAQKLRRYVASWLDPSLRPEAALYGSESDPGNWRFLMPGHSVSLAPDRSRAALLRSGALLAGYYSVHVWQMDSLEAPVVVSLREHGDRATKSFSLSWSRDSAALHIVGRTSGFERRGSVRGGGDEGVAVDLIYLVTDGTLYDLNSEG